MKTFALPVVVLTLLSSIGYGQTSPPVPSTYQDLYSQLSSQISSFSATVHAGWNGAPYPVIHSNALLSANSDMASSLLNAGYYTAVVLPEIIEHKALGAQALTVHINFPILYQPFYSNPQDYQSYVSFYQQVAQDVHSRGMKLIVESTTASPLAGTNGAFFGPYYPTMSWNDYMTGRAQNALNISQQIAPDYMSVITEPDTEASNTGQTSAGTQSGSLQLLQTILSTLQNAGATTPIGAGAGTWLPSFTSWIQGYAATSIQYVDIHVYAPNRSYLPNILSAADTAHAAGKPIAMTEAWLEKVRDSELSPGTTVTFNDIEARYTYSFWSPLDISFLQAMVDMSQYKQFLFIDPSWTRYYFAYLDYNAFGAITDDNVVENDAASAAVTANDIGAFTPTGLAWETMTLPAPDGISPSAPAAPTVNTSQTQIVLNWTPTTDDVGVAGYSLYRNGSLINTTSGLQFQDLSLTPGTSYTYTLAAFDATGNISPLSTPLVTSTLSPPDTQAPTSPANIRGVGLSDKQIQISWNASTDNVAVTGYRVLRGSSPTSLTNIASTATTVYIDSNSMYPNTTYYYAVVAYDAVNNVSPQTAVIAVTPLPDTTPPTIPAQLTATPISSQQINLAWGASTDDISVAGYKIYRGNSPSSLSVIGSAAAASTVYSDMSVSSTQSYYYTVAAFDGAGNYSAQSAPVLASPVPDTQLPSTPTHLSAVAVSMTQVNLSWSASTDNVGVSGYKLYRGTTAQSLVMMASTSGTTWNDSNGLAAGKLYYYSVAAYDAAGNYSPQAAPISVTTAPDNSLPTTPANFSGTPVSMTQINLAWSPSTDNLGVSGYKVYRGTTAQSLVMIASTPGITWSDSNALSAGKTYYYTVAAYDAAGNYSPQTAPLSATTQSDNSLPTTPASVTGTAVSMTQINLSWSPSTDNVGVSGYKVYRGTSAQNLVMIASTPGTTWSDSNALSAGKTYYYAIAAYDAGGNYSPQTTPITVTTPQDNTLPTTPAGLAGVAISTTQIDLTWLPSTDNLGVSGYKIYRGTTSQSLVMIASTPGITWNDMNALSAGKTYYYAVASYDAAANYSPQTAPIAVTTPAK